MYNDLRPQTSDLRPQTSDLRPQKKFALTRTLNTALSPRALCLFSQCFLSAIFLTQGISYGQKFSPMQEGFIKDNRPKPNVMFVLDTSSIGLDNTIILSDEEQEFFKKYLSGQSSISKTEAVAIAYQKLLDEYWTVAHFALGKVIDKSAYTYTMYPAYKKKEALDESQISTVIVPFLNQGIAYAGNYSVISKEEYQQNQKIRNELKQFHTKHSTPSESRRAWAYSLAELYKYSSGLPIVKSISEETSEDEGQGLKRITFTKPKDDEKYADPMKFVCQNSYILYSPVEISRDFAEEHNGIKQDFDAAVGLDNDVIYGNNMESVPNPNKPGTGTPYYRFYKLSEDLYGDVLNPAAIDAMATKFRARMSNINSTGLDNASMLVGGAMIQQIHPSSGKDLYGNSWSGFNGSAYWKTPRYSSTGLTAAQTYISGVYFGDPIAYEKVTSGYTVVGSFRNELQALVANMGFQKDYDKKDYLVNFLQPIFIYHSGSLARYEGNGGMLVPPNAGSFYSGVSTSRTIKQSYTRSDANNEPTLMGLYLRHKEYLDDIVLKSKNNGRFFTDQHIRDPYDAYIDTTFEVTHNEQLWGSNIKAKRLSVPDQKGACQIIKNANRSFTGQFTDNMGWWTAPDVEPTWETSKTITDNQGDFFTSVKGRKVGIFTLIEEINQVSWLKGKLDLDPSIYRVRNSRLGDIVNSSIRYVAKDHFYTNLALVGNRDKYIDYMFLKHENLYQNLIIAGSNDGFINFIVAGRNHKDKPLQRRASYFVPFFADDINEITKPLYVADKNGDYIKGFTHRYRVDGKINLFDGFVENNSFKTIGLAGMGAGYRGLVGFQLFAAMEENGNQEIDNEIKPLFEITNKTIGFEELGYTYSDFAFVNIDANIGNGSQAVAVFGNGPGGVREKSLLYFINANTGELIGTVDFTKLGGQGGAFSPTLVVEKGRDGQVLKTVYVGDYSGKLFKVEFAPGDLAWQLQNNSAKTMVLFDSNTDITLDFPISTRPYVVREMVDGRKTKAMWIYFSNGGFLQEKDRYDTQDTFLYALRDENQQTTIKQNELNTVIYPDGYKASVGDGPLTEGQRGWKLSLALTETFIKNVGSERLKVKGDELRSSKMIQPVAQNGLVDLAFTTRTLVTRGEDPDNYCSSDLVFTATGQVNLLTGKANITYTSGSNYQNVGRTIIRNQGIVDGFRTYGSVRADSEVSNNDSGINLKLRPEERERLDEYFNYDIEIPEGSCPGVWPAAFAESSNIGGRHEPSSRTSWSWPNMSKIIYYPSYNWGTQTSGGGPSKNFELQLPASGMFGLDGDRNAFQLGSLLWVDPPKPTTRRVNIRRKF